MLHDEFGTSRTIRNFKLLAILSCLITVVFLGLEAFHEHLGGEWRPVQLAYTGKLKPEFRDFFEVGIKQEFLPELGLVDRCRTCHLGIDDPAMASEEVPLRTHPGDLLEHHPIQDFGCTICHQGQGRATTALDAHGEVPHWERPLLRGELVYTGCGICHAENSMFGDDAQEFGGRIVDREIYASDLERGVPGADQLNLGKRLAIGAGCLGCHTYRGRGGTIGPDLTHIGDKTDFEYDYSHLPPDSEHTALAWQKQHFLDPGAVSPDTVMPRSSSSKEEAEALAAYMLSLKKSAVPAHYRNLPPADGHEPLDGRGLYELFCVACHGSELDSGNVPEIVTPSLSNEDLLAVASDEYLTAMIENGRRGTAMQRWDEAGGGLTPAQVERIVDYIRSYAPPKADFEEVLKLEGDPEVGSEAFEYECAACHGLEGEGGLGTRLNSTQLLSILSDEMLARTIIDGRPNTGMPSGGGLSAQDVADLIAFIRSWQEPGADVAEIAALLAAGDGQAEMGRATYESHCATCHGPRGKGGIGPSLSSPVFLSLASDEFLAHSIRDGRPGTSMPAFRHLTAGAIADLIAFVRGFADVAHAELGGIDSQEGDVEFGAILYSRHCAECHGRGGAGGVGPQIANPAFLAHATDAFVLAASGDARHGEFLPEAQRGQLTEARRLDVVAYLRSLQGTALIDPALHVVPGDPERGRLIYEGEAACATCHGVHGEGETGQALGNPAFLEQATEGFIIAATALGMEGTEMPSYGLDSALPLSPADLRDVAAYVLTLPGKLPEGPAGWRSYTRTAEQIENGRELYERSCSSCHEAEGDEKKGPVLRNPEFIAAASDGFLMAAIARGRRNTTMLPFGQHPDSVITLAPDEILDVVGYIRSLAAVAPGVRSGD